MIYATTFDRATRQPLDASTDSGFTTLDEVRDVMGPPDSDYRAMCFYGDVVFSRVRFLLTAPATTGSLDDELDNNGK